MSGIAGSFSLNNKIPVHIVEEMLDTIEHRSLNKPSVKALGPAILGLGSFPTTLEEKHVLSPFSLGTCTAVLDGRLDNRDDLLKSLNIQAHVNNIVSDHEILIHSYMKWDIKCLEKLSGDFSFAIWDGEKLFCGRDRFGVKPFVYSDTKGSFLFASEAKAIASINQEYSIINDEYLALSFIPDLLVNESSDTIYKNIKKLPPAHGMVISQKGIRQFKYWELTPGKTTHYKTESEYYERLFELLDKSIHHRMRSVTGVGTALSGGLDSSSITCLARNHNENNNLGPLHTFSCLFHNASKSDEKEWIDSIIEEGNVIPHWIYSDTESPMVDIEEMLWLNEGPFYGGNYYLQRMLYQSVKKQGINVFLDGEDGDGILSHGYDYLVQLAQSGNWSRFFYEADSISTRFGSGIYYYSRANSYSRYALPLLKNTMNNRRYLQLIKDIQNIHKVTHVSRKKLISHLWDYEPKTTVEEDYSIIRKDLIKKYHFIEKKKERHYSSNINNFPVNDNWLHYSGIINSGNSYVLEQIDRISSYHGLEVRHPFFCHELAEYCISIPSRYKLKDGYTRYHLIKAMEGKLPDKVRLRGDKGDLSHQSVYGFRHFCNDLIENSIDAISPDDPIVVKEEADKVKNTYIKDKDDSKLMDVWSLATYSLWCQGKIKAPYNYRKENHLEQNKA
ncbi:MAG: hypothetical protein JEY91_09875 [Spirochaetaceae bacterium]|nr:hypothetical protein [Spirochaetaceae bacterium]